MKKRSVLMRVHPEFKKIVESSDFSSADFTLLLSQDLWDDKINKKNKKGFGGFKI